MRNLRQILLGTKLSESALASDEYQEQLANQRQLLFAITFWITIFLEVGLWYLDIAIWVRLIVPMMWIGFLIHNNALLILHELWEINDQLAGRKDEFRSIISEKDRNNDGSE